MVAPNAPIRLHNFAASQNKSVLKSTWVESGDQISHFFILIKIRGRVGELSESGFTPPVTQPLT